MEEMRFKIMDLLGFPVWEHIFKDQWKPIYDYLQNHTVEETREHFTAPIIDTVIETCSSKRRRLVRQANYDYDCNYSVTAYIYTNFSGIEDILNTNDWSAVEEFAHEHLYKGNLIEIVNNETGASVRLNPDEYFEDFEGEFPVKSWDLE